MSLSPSYLFTSLCTQVQCAGRLEVEVHKLVDSFQKVHITALLTLSLRQVTSEKMPFRCATYSSLLPNNLCCNLGKLYCLLWWLSLSINSDHILCPWRPYKTPPCSIFLYGSSQRSDWVDDKSIAREAGLSVHGFREWLLYSVLQILIHLKLVKVCSKMLGSRFALEHNKILS